jgi:hypothetical protein
MARVIGTVVVTGRDWFGTADLLEGELFQQAADRALRAGIGRSVERWTPWTHKVGGAPDEFEALVGLTHNARRVRTDMADAIICPVGTAGLRAR